MGFDYIPMVLSLNTIKAVIIVGIAMRTRTVGLLGDVSGTPILFYALDIY